MAQTIQDALANASFYTDGQDYAFIKLPKQAIMAAAGIVAEIGEPFSALLVDKDEVTLMIDSEAIEHFSNRLKFAEISEQKYRLITIDIELEPTLIGFMATISKALAEANITIMPFAAYSRDHLFVPAEHIETALDVLKKLQ